MTLSSCCSAELEVDYDPDGTGCYLCSKCGKACDAVSERSNYEKGLSEVFELNRLKAENAQLKAALINAGKALEPFANWKWENGSPMPSNFWDGVANKAREALSDPTMKRVMEEKS